MEMEMTNAFDLGKRRALRALEDRRLVAARILIKELKPSSKEEKRAKSQLIAKMHICQDDYATALYILDQAIYHLGFCQTLIYDRSLCLGKLQLRKAEKTS